MLNNFFNISVENKDYLTTQIITYLGNKRKLLNFIEQPLIKVKKDLSKDKLKILDGFSGSGIVSRFLKKHASVLHTNDLEDYAKIINNCYLYNKSEIDENEIKSTIDYLNSMSYNVKNGIIRRLYSPIDDKNVKKNDRCFYTNENAEIIDTIRCEIENISNKEFYLGPLLFKSSTNCNTSGVFKGFYKDKHTNIGKFGGTNENSLSRITSKIILPYPVFSNFECEYHVHQEDTNKLVNKIDEVDLVYFDPPYNQHPYSSNYFMLNIISNYSVNEDTLSKVSGIPSGWNKSLWNNKKEVKDNFDNLIKNTKSKYILLSYNNEGFLKEDDFKQVLTQYGKLDIFKSDYTVFRGGNIKSNKRNLNPKVSELLFLLKK